MYEVDIRSQLPDYYREIKDFQAIMDAEEPEFQTLAEKIDAVYNNSFIITADSDTITYWESVLGLGIDQSGALEYRRTRVLNRLNTNPPFTYPYLLEKLNKMYGADNYSLEINHLECSIDIVLYDGSYQALKALYNLMNMILPAHIFFHTTQAVPYEGISAIYAAGAGVVTQMCTSIGVSAI